MRIHIVQKGETLWKIAQKYGVNFEELKSANNHLSNPDLIMPGMKVKIPTGSVQAKKESVIPTPKEAPIKEQTPPPSLKEEKEKPIKMPAPPKVQPHLYQQNTHMNFNIYKEQPQQPKVPVPPKMPKPKEVPVVEKPIEKKPIEKKPVEKKPVPVPVPVPSIKKPVEKAPKVKPVPTAKKPLPADCHPVTPVYHKGYCPPPTPYTGYPYPYGCGPVGYPAPGHVPLQGNIGYPVQPVTPGVQQGHTPNQPTPDTPQFGDVTQYQFQQVPAPYQPIHPGYGYNPYVQPGYAYGYYPQQPLWRDEIEEDEEQNN
ncbi:morphogenetic protein associated with SpoVID [Evansella vedderi]|uniref:Morphogenetic protein associated with SpoVID n=1 Tax=Evansella vedderi TaxID=38282 RepID=A0ABT9ZSS7_9BACI|nr:SafA/ExsA family spore coat assembly protein [Evansella vedderi]MDQ0254239.1 morphogenetic protein associated with SpoVID [Evansella vedderi]